MYFKYGSYQHAAAEVDVTFFGRQTVFNQRGLAQFERLSLRIRGTLIDTQSNLTTKIAALEAAYRKQKQDAALYEDDGTRTPHAIVNSQTIGGTHVDAVTWPRGAEGGEYATGRSYEISISGEIALTSETTLLNFQESLSFVGTAGPRHVWIETRNGPAQRQTVSQNTTQRIIQAGNALGLYGYPTTPAPIFPSLEHLPARRYTRTGPRQNGRAFTDYGVQWSYEFESPSALAGAPNAV
jgi:hypothetical protein